MKGLGRAAPLLFLGLASSACQEREAGAPAEVSAGKALAARHACIGQELARQAADDLSTLEQTMAAAPGAGQAATTFARAFSQHAQLRATAYARIDSSVNHSPTTADSTRHAEVASSIQIRRPTAESVEANVATSYDQKLSALLADTDHPCNWKHELGSEGGR